MRARSKYPPLTRAQQALVEQYRDGFVGKLAKRWYRDGVPEDAMSEGRVGLCYAAQRFDANRGVNFATYAAWWVNAFVPEHVIREKGGQVVFGASRAEKEVFFKLGKLRRKHGDDDEACARELGMDAETLHTIAVRITASTADQSLDAELADGFSLASILGCDANPERDAVTESERQRVMVLLRRLPARERLILQRRFFREENLKTIGDALGLSRERVRQLEVQALNRLRLLAEGGTRGRMTRKACSFGHELTKSNTYQWGGRRICKACRAARRRA